MKKVLSLVFVLVLMMSLAASAEIDYSAWGADLPYVPEGESVTLKIAVPQGGDNYDWDKVWFWKWAEKAMNIHFEVEQIPDQGWNERKNLMFASNELPDIIFGSGLSTAEVVKYGITEEQLLPISDYISEELTPNLYAWSQKVSFETCIANNGKQYVFPYIDRIPFNGGNNHPIFVNKEWMESLGFEEMPTTAEELLEVLRAFKADDPNCIPMGSSLPAGVCLTQHILNAFGLQTRYGDNWGVEPAYFQDKEIVIPCATEQYKYFLEYMHTLYEEELISLDFFTMDRTTDFANAAEGKYGMWPYPINQVTTDLATVQKWYAVPTLLSEYNDVYSCPQFPYVKPGNAVISAATKYPEVCMQFMDFWYSDLGLVYGWIGPMADSEDTLGMVGGWYIGEDGKAAFVDVDNGKFTSWYLYAIGSVAPCSGARFNNCAMLSMDVTQFSRDGAYQYFAGAEAQPESRSKDSVSEFAHYTTFGLDTIHYAEKSTWVSYGYFDTATANRIADLKTAISSYVSTECAKFVTGARSLDEFDAYLAELSQMGVDEYLSYYAD